MKYRFGFGMGILLVSLVYAQTEVPMVSVRFQVLSVSGRVVRGLQFQSQTADAEVENIVASRRFLSRPYDYTGSPDLVFFKQERDPVTGEPRRVPLARVRLPEDQKEVLLLFSEARNSGGLPYRVMLIHHDPEKFSAGSYRVFNLTKRTMAMKIDESMFVIKPEGIQTFKPEEHKAGTEGIQISGWVEGEARTLFSGQHSYEPNARKLVFIRERSPARETSLEISVIRDLVQEKKKAPAGTESE